MARKPVEELVILAVREGCLGGFTWLADGGASLDITDPEDGNSNLAHLAAYKGHPHILRALRERGFDMGAKDGKGWTPLIHAARWGRNGVVDYLVGEAGVDPNAAQENGLTPLHFAAQFGDAKMVHRLKEAGAMTDARVDLLDNGVMVTPRDIAAMHKRDEIVRLLDDLDEARAGPPAGE